MKVLLPSFLRPYLSKDLIRLGSLNDGGYVVSILDVKNSNILISMGICDDWKFEKDFLKINNIKLLAFDGSLTKNFWIKKFIGNLINLKFKKFLDFYFFHSFFKNINRNFYLNYVSNISSEKHVNLEDILKKINNNIDNIFLKIDIEGSEYRLLEEIISISHRLSSLVIEFHDVDLNLTKIENFVKLLPLKIIHLHVNNYVNYNREKIPLVIELTFSKVYTNTFIKKLPTSLDRPNDKSKKDYSVYFY